MMRDFFTETGGSFRK